MLSIYQHWNTCSEMCRKPTNLSPSSSAAECKAGDIESAISQSIDLTTVTTLLESFSACNLLVAMMVLP